MTISDHKGRLRLVETTIDAHGPQSMPDDRLELRQSAVSKGIIMMKVCLFLSLAFACFTVNAQTSPGKAKGEVCATEPSAAMATKPFNNETTFKCPSLGSVTVSKIYEKGWRVVQYLPLASNTGTFQMVILIEQQH
ncbi:hypothetical protein [Solilutibacter tolerans]|nr:hypothetical protein [Lysobacter tolerans]